ncbi:hypothetical protein Dimus_027148 [Dionaea muscipula]
MPRGPVDNAEEEFVLHMTMKRMISTVSDSQRHFMHLFHGPDLRREFSQFQNAVMGRLNAFDSRFSQIHADSLRSSNSMARIQADQATQQSRIHSLLVAQAQMGTILSEVRTDIAASEERVLQSIDSLTQLFRRRFPSPSADP